MEFKGRKKQKEYFHLPENRETQRTNCFHLISEGVGQGMTGWQEFDSQPWSCGFWDIEKARITSNSQILNHA